MDERTAERFELIKAHAEITRLEQELRDARYCIGMLIHVAGGRVHISPRHMHDYEPRSVLTTWDDPVSGHRIMELKPSSHSATCNSEKP